jgi:ATP-dependent Lon protease
MNQIEEKLKKYFEGMIVKKDSVQNLFSALSIPSFLRDWFLKRYSDKEGNIDIYFINTKIKEILPRKEDWNFILDKIMKESQPVRFLVKIIVRIDVKTSIIAFEMPDFGVSAQNTLIPENVWRKCKENLLFTEGDIWGVAELTYGHIKVNNKQDGKIILNNFQGFRPYTIDLNYYIEARKHFELNEWIDVLLGAIDYNAEGFSSQEEKLMMLLRLLPFIEKRINLIELAPKGTGKSYLFSQISKRGWLSSGGVMTRAKMFYDMKSKEEGLVSHYDFVALDEIATIKFPDINEMRGAMKGYLESGAYTVGIKSGSGDSGIVLLGNIKQQYMNIDENMFSELPEVFQESALLDRFHGFIEGWKIPRMHENMKVNGFSINCEYFSEILHYLREDVTYRALIDSILICQENSDTRDVTAIKRLTTALVKLLFPHWRKENDIDVEYFEKFCLMPAIKMRSIIKKQMGILDVEYYNKNISEIKLKTF